MEKKIVISSSMKFKEQIRQVMSELEIIGFEGVFPNLDAGNDGDLTIKEKENLAWGHYRAIDNCDAIYFILPEGYMGTSCKLELGYALAKKKPVYFSELTNDIGLDSYPKEIIGLDNLDRFSEIFVEQ